jgi:flagellar biosynthesis protein FlhB
MAQRSIAKEVPEATVVITNPTHYAVALKFDRNQNPVPIVVAKGADHLAKKIIELAREHKVPVVERKPVARYLYHKVPVGKSIPFEMYQAVAEIINFINRLRKAA